MNVKNIISLNNLRDATYSEYWCFCAQRFSLFFYFFGNKFQRPWHFSSSQSKPWQTRVKTVMKRVCRLQKNRLWRARPRYSPFRHHANTLHGHHHASCLPAVKLQKHNEFGLECHAPDYSWNDYIFRSRKYSVYTRKHCSVWAKRERVTQKRPLKMFLSTTTRCEFVLQYSALRVTNNMSVTHCSSLLLF